MLEVGLTGGIGAGKSAVGAMLTALGATVVDSDALARRAVAAGTPTLAAVARRFGPGVLGTDGELDRPALARLVFADPAARRDLEALVHPEVERLGRLDLAHAWRRDPAGIVVVEVPLLFELGWQSRYHCTVLVVAEDTVRLSRLAARGLDETQARARMAAQMAQAQKRRLADFVVDNTGPLAETRKRVSHVWLDLCSRAQKAAGAVPTGAGSTT